MNFLNRTIVIFQILLAIVVAPILIVMLLAARPLLRQWVEPTFTKVLADATDFTQVACVGVLVLVFAIALIFLLLELARPTLKHLKVQSIEGAEVSITAEAIIRRIEYEIDSLVDVIKAQARVAVGKEKTLNVSLDLMLSPEADIASKTQEVAVITKRAIEERMNFKAGKIEIKIDHAKLPPLSKAKKTTALTW